MSKELKEVFSPMKLFFSSPIVFPVSARKLNEFAHWTLKNHEKLLIKCILILVFDSIYYEFNKHQVEVIEIIKID